MSSDTWSPSALWSLVVASMASKARVLTRVGVARVARVAKLEVDAAAAGLAWTQRAQEVPSHHQRHVSPESRPLRR